MGSHQDTAKSQELIVDSDSKRIEKTDTDPCTSVKSEEDSPVAKKSETKESRAEDIEKTTTTEMSTSSSTDNKDSKTAEKEEDHKEKDKSAAEDKSVAEDKSADEDKSAA